mmetsp:Transcript_7103/g.11477  ORF Transcript_7103/g.11477 Transcript_7103/m.11477 type:complete len:327 (+) Transcript_7103:58-1038(+)
MAVENVMLDGFLQQIGPNLKPVFKSQMKVFFFCSSPEDEQRGSLPLAQAKEIIEAVGGIAVNESKMKEAIDKWRMVLLGKARTSDMNPRFPPLSSIILVSMRGSSDCFYEHDSITNMIQHAYVQSIHELIKFLQVEGTVAKETQWLADIFDICLFRLPYYLSTLQKVSFRPSRDFLHSSEVTDEIIRALARACPNLVEIDLSGTKVTDIGIRQIAANCRKIECICLEDTDVTYAGVKAFVRACPQLESIVLYGTVLTVVELIRLAFHIKCKGWKRIAKEAFGRAGENDTRRWAEISPNFEKDTKEDVEELQEALLNEDLSNTKIER